ncbi:MAG: UUP1 family membrane protein [Luteolibacter sp.]
MSARWKLLVAVVALVFTGAGIAAYKTTTLGVPFWQGERVDEWMIEARIAFFAPPEREVVARFSLPSSAIEGGYGQESGSLAYSFELENNLGEYTAVWTGRQREGAQALYYRLRVPDDVRSGAEPLAATGRPPTPQNPGLSRQLNEAALSVVNRIVEVTSQPDAVFSSIFRQIHAEGQSQEIALLKRYYEREYRGDSPIHMGIELLAIAGIPARIAYGVHLEKMTGSQSPHPMIEYFDGSHWKVRDPLDPSTIPDGRKIQVWHRGGGPLLEVMGGENSRVTFTVVRDRIPLSRLTDLRDSPVMISTILGLPASERAVFRYIVLIPLGAFVVVVMRNIIGVATLGTFMPVLLALALLEIPILGGLAMFSILLAAGLWFRFLLSRLNLLVVPRVAACVVIVTLIMMLISILNYRLGLDGDMRITLFPMIIIAWTIERMSLIWEEEGKRNALIQVSGSIIVAVCAYKFMKISQLQYWAYYFPELLLILLAGILLIGRYTGYRFSELVRFRSFSEA